MVQTTVMAMLHFPRHIILDILTDWTVPLPVCPVRVPREGRVWPGSSGSAGPDTSREMKTNNYIYTLYTGDILYLHR